MVTSKNVLRKSGTEEVFLRLNIELEMICIISKIKNSIKVSYFKISYRGI